MLDFFKNIAEKSACRLNGVCSMHPSINSLYQIILSEIREISFYLVKLKEFKLTDLKAQKICIEGLSVFFINTSYNENKYLEFVKNLYETKKEVKEKYIEFCKQNEFPCETINSANLELKDNTTTTDLINYAQNNLINKNVDKKKQRLFELITIFARLCAIEALKLKKMNENCSEFDFEILRFFALTNSYSIRNEKILRRISEFSNVSLNLIKKLDEKYQEKYGKKEDAQISTTHQKGHGILISGNDLDELEELLKTIEKLNPKDEISVYTNGALILAHFYPYFKNNKYLKGHFGSDNAEYDFSVFPGSILITQNFIQKIDSLYRGEIFSNKLISFTKVFDIKNGDYTPVVDSALKLEGFLEQNKTAALQISYDKNEIENFIENFDKDEIIIVSGSQDDKSIKNYENKTIINLNCPLENDILFNVIKKLKEKNVKITLFFAQCSLASLNIVLSLLNQDISLNMANCPHALINPHVVESLKEDFKVEII